MTTAEHKSPQRITFEAPGLSPFSRIALGLLLLANVVLLGYVLLRDPPPVAMSKSTAAMAEPLVALGDLSPEERDQLRLRPERDNARPPLAPGGIAQEQLVCRVWGPFANDTQLSAVEAVVMPAAEKLETYEGALEAPPDYLVYLETDSNLDNARRLLQELESQSVEAYVIAG
ncbi:MAG: hypothetical protein AAGE43_19705, partial [Pseudomonadota bacterium]